MNRAILSINARLNHRLLPLRLFRFSMILPALPGKLYLDLPELIPLTLSNPQLTNGYVYFTAPDNLGETFFIIQHASVKNVAEIKR